MVNCSQQKGSVLLISIMLLIVLTLMTFTLSNSVLLQQKMATDNRDDALALQIAEFALRDAEEAARNFAVTNQYTMSGNQGLYDGRCDIDDSACFINTLADINYFDADSWTDENSRLATTAIACPHGEACPGDADNEYQLGRFKLVLLGEVDITFSGAESIRVITSQNQDANDTVNFNYWLYRVVAMGTGVSENNRRVIVSHFVAPAP